MTEEPNTETPRIEEPKPNDQLNMMVHNYLKAVVVGLIQTHQGVVHPALLWEATVEGFARLMSEATLSTDVKQTLDLRGRASDTFNRTIRSYKPALSVQNELGLGKGH